MSPKPIHRMSKPEMAKFIMNHHMHLGHLEDFRLEAIEQIKALKILFTQHDSELQALRMRVAELEEEADADDRGSQVDS